MKEVNYEEGNRLIPEFAHMTFFPVMSVVICVKDRLVIVDTACPVGERERQR